MGVVTIQQDTAIIFSSVYFHTCYDIMRSLTRLPDYKVSYTHTIKLMFTTVKMGACSDAVG